MIYLLDIYTWPTMNGTDVSMRKTRHKTPVEAAEYLRNKSNYACAVLSVLDRGIYKPCDWSGNLCDRNWPIIYGENKQHPAYAAFIADYDRIVSMVRYAVKSTGKPAVDIAANIMAALYPDVIGYAEHIAWEAVA